MHQRDNLDDELMSNWKAIGPHGPPAGLRNLDHPLFAQCIHNLFVNV